MFPFYRDRVLMTVTGNPGTGTVTLGSAVSGYQSVPALLNSLSIDFCIFTVDGSGNPTGLWEVQRSSTYTSSGTTLTRSAVNVVDGSSGPGTLVNFSSGSQRAMIVLPSDRVASLASTYNYLINGDFTFYQRSGGATANTPTDKYSADRWRTSCDDGSTNTTRQDTLGSPETGLASRYYGVWFNNVGGTYKSMVYQILENRPNTAALSGQVVTCQIKMKASSNKTMNFGLLSLNSSGTVDTIPSTFVSAMNADGTDPTLGSNLAYNAPTALLPGAQGSIVGNKLQCSVTTSWQQFGFTITGLSNLNKNYILAVWEDSAFGGVETFNLAEAGIFIGSGLREYQPRSYAAELALCQRYYEKGSLPDLSPTRSSGADIALSVVSNSVTNGAQWGQVRYQVMKRVNPTAIVHPYTTGTVANAVSNNSGTDFAAHSGDSVGDAGYLAVQNNSGGTLTTSNNLILFKFEADAEL